MMWGDGYEMGWGVWLLIGLGVAGFWVLIAVVVRALMTGTARSSTGDSDPLQVLDDRLAKGEIDIEEYQYRRRLIVNGH